MRQTYLRRSIGVLLVALPFVGLGVVACVSDSLGNKGASCARASECAGGLVCVDSVCTDDLSKLDGGTSANFTDSGSEAAMEASAEAGDAPPDTGTPPDTGMPPADTGMPPADTGMPPVDTGPEDTGTPPGDTATD